MRKIRVFNGADDPIRTDDRRITNAFAIVFRCLSESRLTPFHAQIGSSTSLGLPCRMMLSFSFGYHLVTIFYNERPCCQALRSGDFGCRKYYLAYP